MAIPKIGVRRGFNRIAFIFIMELKFIEFDDEIINSIFSRLKIKRDDSVLKGNKNTLDLFGFTTDEISTVPNDNLNKLILERIAFIDIIK